MLSLAIICVCVLVGVYVVVNHDRDNDLDFTTNESRAFGALAGLIVGIVLDMALQLLAVDWMRGVQ